MNHKTICHIVYPGVAVTQHKLQAIPTCVQVYSHSHLRSETASTFWFGAHRIYNPPSSTHTYMHKHVKQTHFSGPGSCPPSLLSEPSSRITVSSVLLILQLLLLVSLLSVEESCEDPSEIIPWSWSRGRETGRGRASPFIKSLVEVTLKVSTYNDCNCVNF